MVKFVFTSSLFTACTLFGTSAMYHGSMQSLGGFTASMVPKAIGEEVTVVTGNEGGDADSTITALTYAYLLHMGLEDVLGETQPVAYNKFMREDMSMRPETVMVLKNSNVDPAGLLFNDDPSAAGFKANMTQMVLTDHNKADGEMIPYGDLSIQIFDHHIDQGDYPWIQGEDRDIAFDAETGKATAASAATVVCEQFIKHPNGMDLLSLDDGAVALALQSVIMIDGSNKPESEGGKLTSRDLECLDVLEGITGLSDSERDQLYKDLKDAKNDPDLWEEQSTAAILRYDFKAFYSSDGEKVTGISSCPLDLEDLSKKEDWVESLSARIPDYDLYLVTTKFTKEDGSKGREILFSSCDEELMKDAVDYFVSYDDGLLELESIDIEPLPDFAEAWDQGNTKPSRKQIGPIAQSFLNTLDESPACVGSTHIGGSNIFSKVMNGK